MLWKKKAEVIFSEFFGKAYEGDQFGGDVKYHMGFSSDKYTALGKRIHMSMPPNPSHLEAVNPVVEGIVGAKIRDRYSMDNSKIAPILIHGDAAIAGQGINYEVSQMSELEGYKTGGTIHLVLNNQIGFTTGYKDARSSTYCTDLAKITKSPVFHVNGDDIVQLIVAPKHSLALENIVQSLHPDMLAKDGLFKLLQQIFGAEKLRILDKKTILKHQKKLKELVNTIDRVGNFGVEQISHTEMFQKLTNLLKKFDGINYKPDGSRNTSRKIRYQFIHIMNNQKNKKTSEGDSAEPENKDHLAYLTSS